MAQVMRLDAAAAGRRRPGNTRVRQREQRHDDEAGQRVKPVLELLEDRTSSDRAGRRQQPEHDAGDGRVDAGLERRDPQERPRRARTRPRA